jgi:hypothetical protein
MIVAGARRKLAASSWRGKRTSGQSDAGVPNIGNVQLEAQGLLDVLISL